MSFLDNDKHPFTLVLSPKFQDINFLNSFEIDNIEKYLEIKQEDIQELEHLCEIAEEADGRTYLRLPLDDSMQFREITQRLQDSVHFLSRIISPKKRQKRLGRSYMDDKTRREETSTPMNLNEGIEVEKEDGLYIGEETQMFADFERILKEFEISAVKTDSDNKVMFILEDCKKAVNNSKEIENKSILSGLRDESKLSQLSPIRMKNTSFSPSKRKRVQEELIKIEENLVIESGAEQSQPAHEDILPDLNIENQLVVSSDCTGQNKENEVEKKENDKDKEKKRTKIYIKGNTNKNCAIF